MLLFFLVITGQVLAATSQVNICAKYYLNLTDAAGVGDDYMTDGTAQITARGIHLLVRVGSLGHVVFDNYTDELTGCTGNLTLTNGNPYTIRMWSDADLWGNTVIVLDNNNFQGEYSYAARSTLNPYIPAGNDTVNVVTPQADQWNIAAVAGQELFRSNGGMTGEDFIFYNTSCNDATYGCDTGGTTHDCLCSADGRTYIDAAALKYLIAHETGHQFPYKSNGNTGAGADLGADYGSCPGEETSSHAFGQKEYQSGAANEGIAHYFAALAFNSAASTDCKWNYYKNWDFDDDGTYQEPLGPFACAACGAACSGSDGLCPDETVPIIVDCNVGPVPNSAVDAHDYLGDECDGTLTNRGSEYDWLRFFWEMDTQRGLTPADILDVWVTANPDTWNATGDNTDSDNPASRLSAAAAAEGFGSAWDDAASIEGVDR
jgi:hypothetical protein